MSEQLRECPFCGKATAHALIAKEQMPGYRAWKLSVRGECTNQGCRTLGPQYSLIVPQDIDLPYKTEEWHAVIDQAIAAWNQRAGCASCRDEAIAAALAVEQKCYDQAQEIKALRALREALDSALEVVDGEWVRDLQVNPPKGRAVMDALIASKQASAPTGDEHTK